MTQSTSDKTASPETMMETRETPASRKTGAKLTKAVAAKVLEVVDAGLVKGVGEPIPGKMCVEAAVCYALGEPHGDKPSCVGAAVRSYKIRLNDARWSSDQARAEGMREIAIAQLGSDTIDQKEFSKRIAIRTVQTFVPIALRAIVRFFPEHAEALEIAAKACEAVGDLAAARSASANARKLTTGIHAFADAYAAADAATAADADAAAYKYAYAAAATAAAADAYAAAYAAEAAAAYKYAYAAAATAAAADAYAYAYADADADADADAKRDSILKLAADMGVAVLRELKSPGAKWLGLCKMKVPHDHQ